MLEGERGADQRVAQSVEVSLTPPAGQGDRAVILGIGVRPGFSDKVSAERVEKWRLHGGQRNVCNRKAANP